MSDEPTSTEQTEPTEPTTDETQKQGDPADEPLGETGKKALLAEREARKAMEKQLSEAKARLAEFEREKMSELERAQVEAQEAREAADKAIAEALRLRVAVKHNISEEDAELFLTGTDEETLTKQAQRLAERRSSDTNTPKPDLTQGGTGDPAPRTPSQAFADAVSSVLQ